MGEGSYREREREGERTIMGTEKEEGGREGVMYKRGLDQLTHLY